MSEQRENACVLALGFFDGVHLGHAALLRRTVERARESGIAPAVMTFDNHPDALLRGTPVELINSRSDRERLIRTLFDIQRVEVFHFDRDSMRMSWRDFLSLCRSAYGAVHFVVGYDFRFGWRGEGNPERLREYCRENGLGCDVIDPVVLDGVTVSSTHLRELLSRGDMPGAARFLGHPHVLTDTVRSGRRLGRRIGAPTVNMGFAPGVLIPPYGVYAVRFSLPEGIFSAVTNIGTRPTVDDSPAVTVESYILDFEGDLYGQTLTAEFIAFIRPERRFGSLEELSAQIAKDTRRAREILRQREG